MTLKDSARPLSVDGGKTGVLVIHGFTGSPASMRPWGQHLADLGHTVRVPRLPGHGTTWQELNRTRWQDWYAEVDTALTELRSKTERVVLCGLSMGGCLSLRLAEQRPDDVAGLVLVNPAIRLDDKRLLAVPLLRHFVPSIAGIANDIKKPGVDESGYDRTPIKALHSQMQMWKDVVANLSEVTAPLLMFRSAVDHVVDASSGKLIMSGVSSSPKREVLLTDSYHVATLDNEADLIYAQSATFIEEIERKTEPIGRDG